MKNKIRYLSFIMLIGFNTNLSAQSRMLTGTILSRNKIPIVGASIITVDSKSSSTTDSLGNFTLLLAPGEDKINIRHINYDSKLIKVDSTENHLIVYLVSRIAALKEVVISTGYQSLSKNKSLGSYDVINNQLINRSTGTDILSRLDNVTSSLLFDKRFRGSPTLSIRGQSTIQSDASPLIVVDNFPYEGDINNINPNDVESVTILKDAAAASIWGVRAGNGVIVITTKRGHIKSPLKIVLNSNVTLGDKPDLYYNREFLDASDFIDVEESLFNQNYYTWMETSSSQPAMSPVVQLLIAQRDGQISSTDAETLINQYRQKDVRKDFSKYFYRNSLNQQYSLSLSGGGAKVNYYLSGGFDKNNDNLIRNGLNRITINSNLNYHLSSSFDLSSNIVFSESDQAVNNIGSDQITSGNGKVIYPYASIADKKGNPLSIVKDYNTDYINQAQSNGLLDWSYDPLADMRDANSHVKTNDIRINTSARYHIGSLFSIEGRYQYERQNVNSRNLQSEALYYTRNLINQYTYMNPDSTLSYPIPKGAILDNSVLTTISHAARLQVNLDETWGNSHELKVLLGTEIRQTKTIGSANRLYGYNDGNLTYVPVDLTTSYLISPDGYTATIPSGVSLSYLIDRNLSYYGNADYTYKNRYFVSVSARKDEANLFGVDANKKGVPLWSAGLGWQLSSEGFYPLGEWLPLLKLRATYGYSGNVNRSLTAYTTGSYSIDRSTHLPYIQIMTPPNPDLKWEKIKMVNFGLDFRTKGSLLSGSIEYYIKRGVDLISPAPLGPTVGFVVGTRRSFLGNNGRMSGRGLDIDLRINKHFGKIDWTSQILYSYSTDKITKYDYENYITSYFSQLALPMVGKPRYGIYSLKWAGLDPGTGDPQIILNGKISKDYSSIMSKLTEADLLYNGPAIPTHFGSFRNSFGIGHFSIGFNIVYKLGYYFRKPSIDYSALFNNWIGNVDFKKRWVNPGDEHITQVPSMPPAGTSSTRDFVYTYSNILVEKGDNIRFQDINFSYEFDHDLYKWIPFKKTSLYGYINNIGFIWRANKDKIDPDYIYQPYPTPTTYSIGLKIQF